MVQRVAVVGAGVIGLATASELKRAGAEVRCYERAEPGGQQSKGLTRIFRHAHRDPRMVSLAMDAGRGWRAWEQRFGLRLVGTEGMIVTGEQRARGRESAMREAGASCRFLTPDECKDLLPICTPNDGPALFDPAGGATRVRRIIHLLGEDLGTTLVRDEVTAVEAASSGPVLRTSSGTWNCDEVIISAGVETVPLARPLGLDVPAEIRHHSRFTFEIRPEYRAASLPCWIDDRTVGASRWHAYGQRVGSTDRYAVGVGWDGQQSGADTDPERVGRESSLQAEDYVRAALEGLDPSPVDEIRCTSNEFPFLVDGDGFVALRRDGVTAFYGNNLFKFAPLLGSLLAQTAMTGEVPEALRWPIASTR